MAEERGRYLIEFKDIPAERQRIPEIAVEERVTDFREVALGFTRELAMSEAARCLSCRRCLGCKLCLAECHTKAIDFDQADQDIEIEVDSILLAPEIERVTSPVNGNLGYGKYLNVVSGMEFERILSDNGPYGGLVLRPYDGEIPKKIAFVQCSDQQNPHSLSHTVKEILLAQKKIEGLESCLYIADSSVTDGDIEKHLGKGSNVSLKRAKVLAAKEVEDSKNVVVEFAESEGGSSKEEEFDMVVLSTGFNLPGATKELTRKLGVETKGRRFWETDGVSPAETSRSGVFFVGYDFAD